MAANFNSNLDSSSSITCQSDFYQPELVESEEEEVTEVLEAVDPARIEPFRFEPQAREVADGGPVLADDGAGQNNMNNGRAGVNDWCTCGHCQPMPTDVESICCREYEKVLRTMGEGCEDGETVCCITEHPGFQAVCLNMFVLRTAYWAYKAQYPRDANRIPTLEEKYRYTAYRQLVRWCWGLLGRFIRIPLPACAVCRIRLAFPSQDGTVQGFKHALLHL